MVKQGWVRKRSHKGEQVEECLRFFGVASVEAWLQRYSQPLVAFRASGKSRKQVGAVAAWLREAERQATALRCAPYDKGALRDALPELRALTVEADPEVFVPRVQQACAAVGVAVVFVPAPPGCPVHGATRWLTPEKALLALSLRYKSDDQLWFSFFHEAAHILKHARKQQFSRDSTGSTTSSRRRRTALRATCSSRRPPRGSCRACGARARSRAWRGASVWRRASWSAGCRGSIGSRTPT
jgi:hypothetical protein